MVAFGASQRMKMDPMALCGAGAKGTGGGAVGAGGAAVGGAAVGGAAAGGAAAGRAAAGGVAPGATAGGGVAATVDEAAGAGRSGPARRRTRRMPPPRSTIAPAPTMSRSLPPSRDRHVVDAART